MYKRNLYIDRIKPYVNKPVIKVITGMRRVGKSYLLRLIIENIKAEKIPKSNILYINKESLDYDFIQNYNDLNDYVKSVFSDVKG